MSITPLSRPRMLALMDDAVTSESAAELARLRGIVERLPAGHHRRMVLTLITVRGRELHEPSASRT